ncbi:Pectinesterase, catalytic [Penicillium expansum]|uniref:pectinesterase n=1 Tax=Penicillium expansum TaxID=27334 RepID=A0A0A2L287_PENEN|nr:Pectinesterase, catalytic [Penicillium expansum]KGO57953.1 Pectinesterase, catalytic [Penicillium expansum]KGO70705.1 Pectinesterase, catalytic [Penicillium expansum]
MRAWSVLGFAGLSVASAISSVPVPTATTSVITTTSATSTETTTSASTSTSTSPTSTTIVTVATDSSGQFTVIGDAINYAQSHGIPTVTVLAGTYTQAVTVSATPTVTVIGQSDAADDYTQNEVTITNAGTVLTINNNVQQVSFKNVNFLNTASGSGAMVLKGNKYSFYDCQIVSTGTLGVTASVGLGIIANSYIEALDKILYGGANLYVYNTKIVPVDSSALLAYMKGTTQTSTSTLYNSTVIFDHVTVAAKTGSSISNVAFASANGPGVVVLVRNSALGSLIAATGAHVDTISQDGQNLFAEYSNTGSGAYASNAVTRAQYVSVLDASVLSEYSVSAVFAAALPGYASADTTWVDSSLLAAIQNADKVQSSSVISTPTASTVASSTALVATSTTAAATATSTFIVNPTAGPYKNVTAAIAALPNDSQEYTIYVMAGTYNEQISITRTGKTILRGETTFENDYTQNTVTISYSNGVLTSANKDEDTPIVNAKNTDGKGLAIYNINFQNTYPQTANTAALAADFYGTVQSYGCSFIGYQDTLLANMGTQVFSNCYVEGSIDFIWGFSTAYFYQSVIATNTAGSCIAAMSRSSSTATGGYVFDTCLVTYTSSYGSTYQNTWLGRPYSSYSRVVYMNSYLDKHINPAGWHVWSTSSPQTDYVTFGEFNNTGPGSWSSSRASFATNLTEAQADAYTLSNWVGGTSWLDMDAYDYVPSYNLTPSATTSATNVSTASAVWAHPSNGTTPPTGAVLVSVSGSVNGSYANLTDALASLPDDTTTQIIFIYAGTYEEQVPTINRNGPVMIIGYTTGNPGQSYADNQVTITFAHGLSVSPLPTGHSDAETATVATASTQIAFYNVNIINSDNLDGLESSYVTLAASIYGNHVAFYGVWFQGWQDTLLTGSTTGYQYYESSYIEGAIDFIWGYSKAYFKGCTIGAKKAKSAITAHSRASSTAIGGYIFDQTLFTAAADATVDLTETIYLGRPYSQYALVVVKNSYLTDVINPSGWKAWSTSDPRTSGVTFAEFNNTGPGNWENNAAAREAFGYATLLTEDTYSLASVMDSTDWIDMTHWDSIDTPTAVSGTATTTATPTPTPTAIYDGTTPPSGAYIVSQTSLGTNTTVNTTVYDTIQSALNAIPTSSKVTPTIFIYPGTYEEQLIISKSGSVVFMGYSESTYDYSSNQVTIQYNHGIDTGADQSNSDGATVYATGNYFEYKAININFVNNNGTQKDIATLGFAVKSSKYASLYGCQVKGNQDALLINGNLFMSNGYVEGNIDMIWGSGAGYFLNTTISPNEDGINLTADKRTTNTTAGGFVFDQCEIIPSTGAGSMSKISLGRPWNQYARVAYIDSYLDSCVEAAGWEQWSKSSPQTSGVTFAEYGNYGPGSSTLSRATFASQLTDTDVVQFELAQFFFTTSWIDFTHVEGTPFVPGTTTTVSSAAVPSATPSRAIISSAIVSTPLLTFTTTVDVISTSTTGAFITVTPTDTISTVQSTTILTLTPEDVTKTTTLKSTITSTNILTEPTITSTKTSIVTTDIGSTITPDPKTVTTTSKATTTDTVTITGKDTTKIVKSTVTSTSTISAAASTVTDKETVTITSVKTTSAKAGKTTSIATVTVGSEGTTTVSAKATTEVVTSISTKTATKKVTTTLSCDAPAKKIKRALIPRDNVAIVTDYVTEIDYVTKTVTTTLPAATDYMTDVTTKTTSLKAATVTNTITSIATKLSTSTIKAVTSIVTAIETTSVGKTTTLKASTVTNTVTSLVEKQATVTLPGQTVTSVSLKTAIVKSTVHLPAVTTTATVTTTVKSTTTLPGSTSTVIKTSTVTNHPSVTITNRATSTSTKVVKTTSTSTVTATKTAKCS